jgi:hypothetical protein
MSEPSSEQDKYTIDEMMDRLKGRDQADSPDSELVTRSDGTQAMKVRKRRRRTDQTVNTETKRNQRVQIIQITGFVVLIIALGLIAGIGILYANSASFRDGLSAKSESVSGAKVVLKQFRMNPATANSAQMTMEWPAGNVLNSMSLRTIVAKIAPVSFLGKIFSGEEIVAATGELIVKAPSAGEPVRFSKAEQGVSPFKFNRYSVPALDIFFGGEKRYSNMLEKTEVSLYPGSLPGRSEVRFVGGLLKAESWPQMELDRSYMKIFGGSIDVMSLRFMIPTVKNTANQEKGFIDFSGKIQPLDTDATHVLAAVMESFRLNYLLGADLGRFILGRVETKEVSDSNFLVVKPGSDELPVLELTLGNALNSRIDLSGFNFLSKLSIGLNEDWYELPNFDNEISMLVKRQGERVEIREIKFEERGRMAVRGRLVNGAGGAISGELQIGLPEGIVVGSKNKKIDMMFGQVREGYRWVELIIGGTSAVPTDNFMELYDAAESSVKEKPEISPKDSFEGLIDEE